VVAYNAKQDVIYTMPLEHHENLLKTAVSCSTFKKVQTFPDCQKLW